MKAYLDARDDAILRGDLDDSDLAAAWIAAIHEYGADEVRRARRERDEEGIKI